MRIQVPSASLASAGRERLRSFPIGGCDGQVHRLLEAQRGDGLAVYAYVSAGDLEAAYGRVAVRLADDEPLLLEPEPDDSDQRGAWGYALLKILKAKKQDGALPDRGGYYSG